MPHLSAIIITYNEMHHISDCIASLQFADQVIVFDSFSTDKTVSIAQEKGARVFQRAFDNFANQRNATLEAVENESDWVLFVDADERVTPELAVEIREVIQSDTYVAYQIPRHNYLFGKLTTGAGWYPDYQTRLLKLGFTSYDPQRQVHELVLLDGKDSQLKHALIHYNYENIQHFIEKQRKYAALDAQMLYAEGVRPRFRNFILQPLRHFRWRYITLKGYQDGWHGFRLSVLMAWYEFKKYQYLRDIVKNPALKN
ncbi:glycosyltransferase family 2 protein [Anaerolineales bacterium]